MSKLDGYFFLRYERSRYLEIVFPSKNSEPFMRIVGKRADKLFKPIKTFLESYFDIDGDKKLVLSLPTAIGMAVSLYLIATYNYKWPMRYAIILRDIVEGKSVVSNYSDIFIEMVMNLSNSNKLNRRAIETTGKIMRILIEYQYYKRRESFHQT